MINYVQSKLILCIIWILTCTSPTFAVPGPVRGLDARLDEESGEVIVTWQPPASAMGGSLTQYEVTYQRIGIGDCGDVNFVPELPQSAFVHPTTLVKRLGVSGINYTL